VEGIAFWFVGLVPRKTFPLGASHFNAKGKDQGGAILSSGKNGKTIGKNPDKKIGRKGSF